MWYSTKATISLLSWLPSITVFGQLVSGSPNFEGPHGLVAGGHHWEKPSDAIRGPCPVMNTLANHGYLPRSGRNITIFQMRNGMREALNIPPIVRDVLTEMIFNKIGKFTETSFVLPDLREMKFHNFIEHDFSLSRQDTNLGDPVNADPELLKQLEEASSEEDMYTLDDLVKLSNKRMKHSLKYNPLVTYNFRTKGTMHLEIALFLDIFGKNNTVSKQTLMDIFARERLPEHFQKSETANFASFVATLLEVAIKSKLFNPEM
ncbi:hypothetical protein K7432_005331 [Basidiobolus ranarum]|uniref:Heme haloperoxidase family profile domain-containing protein n=1 Tax=Basidiobolus ranarum TaxID=34480 RepID=A0ABR2W3D4_9FUNG